MNKRILSFVVILILFNICLLIILQNLGLLVYYFIIGLGISLGLILSEGIVSLKDTLVGVAFWTLFWIAGIMIYIYDDFYKIKVWWFRRWYRINEVAIRRYVEDLVIDLCKECKPIVDVKVGFLDEFDSVVLIIVMRDYDKLVEKEKKIIENITKKFGIPNDRIMIYWDDRWRYY